MDSVLLSKLFSYFKRYKLYIKIAITIFFLYILFTKFADFSKIVITLQNMNYLLLILCIILTFLSLIIRALRWRIISVYYGKRLSLRDSIFFYLYGVYYGAISPGRIGEFLRGHKYSEKYGLSKKDGISSVFFERIFDIIGPIVFVILFYFLGKSLHFSYIFILTYLLLPFLWKLSLRVCSNVKKIKFLKDLHIPSVKVNKETFLLSLLTLFLWGCYSLIALILLFSLGISFEFSYIFFSVNLVSLSSLIPITINGFGLREGGYVLLFSLMGVDASTSLIFSLLFALLATYTLAIVGFAREILKFHKKH